MLVVDDDPWILSAASKASREDQRVLCARGGEQAREIAGREHIDIAIIDRNMPAESGIELTWWFHWQQPHVRVALVSGDALEPEVVTDAVFAGAIECIAKPFNIPQVRERIESRSARLIERGEIPTIAEVERAHAVRVLAMCGGNKTRATKLLGISRGRLAALLRGIPRARVIRKSTKQAESREDRLLF